MLELKPGVLAIGKTKHGTRADARTPTCTSCHGASDAHTKRPRTKPDLTFGKASGTSVAENTACLACHQGGNRILWFQSIHENRDVTCATCHQVHVPRDKVRVKWEQTDICLGCHKQQRIEIGKSSRHPIREGKVTCSDCHNPHGTAGPKLMVRDTINDTCFQCHAEKRGPFIWNHEPVTENCILCHNPHGSTVASLLRVLTPFLCQQCHSADDHRGNFPGLTFTANEEGQQITLARGCVNCHTNIHGSNSPINTSGSRSFRQ